jgi:hypothetical protein
MERRALVLALALAIPLALYGIPYSYASTFSSSYENRFVGTVDANSNTAGIARCNSGDYGTGGGYIVNDPNVKISLSVPATGSTIDFDGQRPDGWIVHVWNPDSSASGFSVYVICQTPVLVAGISAPEFGSLYVAIALGAVAYFMLSRRYAGRPAAPSRSTTS